MTGNSTTSTFTRRPALQQPSKKEIKRRFALLLSAMDFVLEPLEGSGNPPRVYWRPKEGQELIVGDAAMFLQQMFEEFGHAKTHAELSATQSAINLTRRHFVGQGMDLNTKGAQPDTPAAAFGLASVFMHHAVAAAEQAEAEAEEQA